MSLYNRLLEEIDAVGSHEESAAACEDVVRDVSINFVIWYTEVKDEDWAIGVSIFDLYEQFKMSL